jgi:hypothetical protein
VVCSAINDDAADDHACLCGRHGDRAYHVYMRYQLLGPRASHLLPADFL